MSAPKGKKKLYAGILAFVIFSGVAFAATNDTVQVKAKFGKECKVTDRCNGMMFVDCNAAADGPAYYVGPGLEVLEKSGGYCMRGNCKVPPAWLECKKIDTPKETTSPVEENAK